MNVLLKKVLMESEAYCAKQGISRSRLGVKVAQNFYLFANIENGRDICTGTLIRVMDHIGKLSEFEKLIEGRIDGV